MSVEFGKFDLSRLPIDWSKVDPDEVVKATEAIQATTMQKCQELQKTVDEAKPKQTLPKQTWPKQTSPNE